MKQVIILLLSLITINANSQLFDGATNSTGLIYRTGDVGIGTTTPIGKLNVYGTVVFSGSQGSFVLANAYQSPDHFISIAPNSGGTYATNWDWTKALGFFGKTGELQKSVTNNSDIAFSVVGANSTKNLKIYGDGSVVIGNVTNPSGYKLYVQDGILAEKVKIALSNSSYWSDFVFNNNYKLRNLDSIEKFIALEHHLPDMPSGKELYDKGGVDVFEMLKLQQQKIEELYLYTIELNNKVNALKMKSKKKN